MQYIIVGIVGIVGLLVFLGLPNWAKVLITIANIIIPDPLPFLDEVIMIAILLKSLTS